MNENGNSNVTQVLKAFQRFLTCYESALWAKNASIEDIKSTFKLGNFIEKTVLTFKNKDFLAQFLILFEIWGRQNNLKSYSEGFFMLANDHLLGKLFKYPNLKETVLDIGVRVYTSMYTKERFQQFIKTLILTSSSLKVISNFVINSVSDTSFIENHIVLDKWGEYWKLGLKNNLKSEVESYLSLYNVEDKLPRLISILALETTLEPDNNVRDVILECLLDKMVDRSLLSKTFWLSVFKKANLRHIIGASKNYPTFLESILSFIEYIGGMMVKDSSCDLDEWIGDPSISFCHEISYFELTIFLKTLCSDDEIKRLVLIRLGQAKEYSNVELWNQIESDISE